MRDERVSHAYLFSGPRGTGKTSSARILAKALNCEAPVDGEPCGVCTSCTEITAGSSLNVHELDAASNNGVDAMRDLVAHAGLGTPGRWKVYIVDEVHMLSTAAANALLKTLEEPPSHVVFVLATTDPQKVPPTIRSRTQHLEFRLLGAETLHGLLESVNDAAGLELDETPSRRRCAGAAARPATRCPLSTRWWRRDRPTRPGPSSPGDRCVGRGVGGGVLVAARALLAGGWGAQPLATELIDDLRQVFLAALAPDLCAAAGAERDRYTGLAETMGLPRVVRSIEILGQALIDMREAPDAQVVLEIALVRAVAARPRLGDGGAVRAGGRVGALRGGRAGLSPPGAAAGGGVRPAASAPAPSPRPLPPVASSGARSRGGQAAVARGLATEQAAAEATAPTASPADGTRPAGRIAGPAATAAEPQPAEHRRVGGGRASFGRSGQPDRGLGRRAS